MGVISQKVWPPPSLPCRPLGYVSCWLSCLCITPSPGTLGKVMPREGNSPPSSWTLPWRRGEADAPQERAAQRLRLPKEPAHSHGPGQLWVWCPPGPKAEQSRLGTSGACLPCPSCSQGSRCPPCLPEAEQQPKPVKQGEGAARTHQAAQPGKDLCGFLTTMCSLI